MNEIGAQMKETAESSLAPSVTGEKMVVYEPGSRLSPHTKPASALTLDFLDCITVRNNSLLLLSHPVFCTQYKYNIAVRTDWARCEGEDKVKGDFNGESIKKEREEGRINYCVPTMSGPALSSGDRSMNREHFYLFIFTSWDYSAMEYPVGDT